MDAQATAIVGMACRLPGAEGPASFWQNLLAGHDAIAEIPSERWSSAEVYAEARGVPGKARSRWCGLVADVERFDDRFFRISPREARSMDPQQRLLLEESWRCIEDAAIDPRQLRCGRTGVFAGVMADDYQQRLLEAGVTPDAFAGLGNYECILANRVSHCLGLSGPSLSINAACASSLVALHVARRSLAAGDCDYALVAAANLNLHPWKYVSFSQAGMLSPAGRCRTFDVEAAGYVPGDGVAAILLTSVDRARSQGHRIHGIVRGSAINHVGGGASITAPSVASQRSLLAAVAADAGFGLETVSYFEAHGTGTSLGDPIEVAALEQSLRAAGARAQQCGLGSVKTNIGHLEAAAGLAGLIKVLLMMRHETLAPSIHIEQPNPLLELDDACLRLIRRVEDWRREPGLVLRAGVSSFGFGGANAHVLVEEGQAAPAPGRVRSRRARAELFCLGAHTRRALMLNLDEWRAFLAGAGRGLALADLCGVAATRAAGSHRFAACVASHDELIAAMEDAQQASPTAHRRPPRWLLHVGECPVRQAEAALDRLASLGFEAELISFEGRGLTAALRAAGVEDVDAGRPRLSRPKTALLDPVSGARIPCFRAVDGYLEWLAQVPAELGVARLVAQARALWQRQFTLTKYLREWQDPLAGVGVSLADVLEGEASGCALVAVAIATALRRVDERWGLGHGDRLGCDNLEELVDLLVDGALEPQQACRLLAAGVGDEALRVSLSAGLEHIDARRRYAGLRRFDAWLDEVGAPAQWRATAMQARRPAVPTGYRVLRVGASQADVDDELALTDFDEASWRAVAAELWRAGVAVDRSCIYPPGSFTVVDAPTYRFDGRSAWVELPEGAGRPHAVGDAGTAVSEASEAPAAAPLRRWASEHRIDGRAIVPGACLLEQAVLTRAAAQPLELRDVALLRPLACDALELESPQLRSSAAELTVVHAGHRYLRGKLVEGVAELGRLEPPFESVGDAKAIYAGLAARGYGYGPPLRVLAGGGLSGDRWVFGLSPAGRSCLAGLFEAAFQAAIVAGGAQQGLVVPFTVARLACLGSATSLAQARQVVVSPAELDAAPWGLRASVAICGDDGRVLLRLEGVALRRLAREATVDRGPEPDVDELLFAPVWRLDERRAVAQAGVSKGSGSSLEGSAASPGGGERWPERGALWIVAPPASAIAQALIARVPQAVSVEPAQLADFRLARRRLADGPARGRIIVAADSSVHDPMVVVALCRALAWQRDASPVTVLLATRGLQQVGEHEQAGEPDAAALIGVLKAAAHDLPTLKTLAVDLAAPSPADLEALLVEQGPAPLGELAYRGGRRYLRVLEPLRPPAQTVAQTVAKTGGASPLRPGGVYLIVGGLGGLGRALARWLAEHVGARLALIGRRSLDDAGRAVLAELEELGGEAIYLRADGRDRQELAAALAATRARWGRLHGAIHAALSLRDRSIRHLDADNFAATYASKATGSRLLAELTEDDELDCLVLLSSVLSLQGNAGQANYVAACCYQDALAARLRAAGRAAVAVGFGYWGEVGAVADAHHAELLRRQGIGALRVREGVAGLVAALASGRERVVVARLDAARQAALRMPASSVQAPTLPSQFDAPAHLQPHRPLPAMSQLAPLAPTLTALAAAVLEVEAEELDIHDSFTDLGIDSILGVELVAKINDALGTSLEATSVYDYASLAALAAHLEKTTRTRAPVLEPEAPPKAGPAAAVAERLPVHRSAEASDERAPVRVSSAEPGASPVLDSTPDSDEPIAVVGMSGRFPGAADLDAFWRNLVAGVDSIVEWPPERWDVGSAYDPDPRRPNRSNCRYGGFLDGVDRFDPTFFKIAPREAERMDPQQRLFLEEAWRALEDGGYAGVRRAAARVGVFVGARAGDYLLELYRRGLELDAATFTGTDVSMMAARIAYYLDTEGPTMALDTACSSSLVAIHEACQHLRSGEVDLALAGGSFVMNTPQFHIMATKAGMLAPGGRCRTFDDGAEGFVPAEGVGVLLLKPLTRALEDGDQIHGLIRASGINQDGRTNGITAPSAQSQAKLIAGVYAEAGISPASVSYIEAHGTGTRLGDPIEVEGLRQVFADATSAQGCALGSVKSNIGHAITAAGVAGVLKVLLALRHRQLPPSLHFELENRHLELARTPFRVVTQAEAWTSAAPLRAGVSSFGFSGTNCHVVVEQAPAREQLPRARGASELFVLSGATAAALRRRLEQLAAWLRARADDGSLAGIDAADVAYSLAVGRSHARHRAAFVATQLSELAAQLEAAVAATRPHAYGGGSAASEPGPLLRAFVAELVERAAADPFGAGHHGRLEALADAYIQGHTLDWTRLYPLAQHRIVALPTYPFERERHWPEFAEEAVEQPVLAGLGGVAAQPGRERLVVAQWQAATLTSGQPIRGTVAVLRGARPELAEALARALPRVVQLEVDDDLAARCAAAGSIAALVDLSDLPPVAGAVRRTPALERIRLIQALVASQRHEGLAVLHVSDRLTAWGGAGRFDGQAALVAELSARLAAEHACVRGRSLDLDLHADFGGGRDSSAFAETVLAELRELLSCPASAGGAAEVVRRGGDRQSRALTLASPTAGPGRHPGDRVELRPRAAGVYLITGGVRGLGLAVAEELVARGARKLILLGRRPLPARDSWSALLGDPQQPEPLRKRLAPLQALVEAGVELRVHTGELSKLEDLAATLDDVRGELGAIRGVVHCAGVARLDRPVFVRKTVDELAQVCEPKLAGLEMIDRLLADDPLDFAVVYSSVSTLAPALAVGLLDYAAANAVANRWAEHRRAAGRPAVSLAWGNWIGTGMGAVAGRSYGELGLATHDVAVGLEAGVGLLDRALATGAAVVAPLHVDAKSFVLERLGRLQPRPRPELDAAWPARTELPAPIGDSEEFAAPSKLRERVAAELRAALARAIKLPEARIDSELQFADLGVDSILVVEFICELEGWLGEKLDPSIALEHPSIAALAAHLADSETQACVAALGRGALQPAGSDLRVADSVASQADPGSDARGSSTLSCAAHGRGPEGDDAALTPERGRQHAASGVAAVGSGDYPPLAIIGMAGHLPGAPDLERYWQRLRSGSDCTREIPGARWSIAEHYSAQAAPGKSVSKRGGFLDNIESFDPAFFDIPTDDAAEVDPLVRQFLEVGVECVHHAGYRREELAGRRVGVFVGSRISNYAERIAVPGRRSLLGIGQNFIAAHLAHFYDLRGPALVVDTACSSSLTSLHQAAVSLHAGECELALAGGVDILLDEVVYQRLSEARVLSPDGRCYVFDERANGFVPGEGAGAVLLKPLDRAIADADRIYAVVEATAINNDGRTMGVTTPNPEAQQRVVREALQRAGRDARDIGYVEAHGTGTSLGDPIELRALTELFRSDGVAPGSCPVGSVKSNLGHLLSAAGMASVLKVALALEARELPPTLHCERPNPRFDFAASPFWPCTELRPWSGPRRAGISSFGFGGTNVHAILAAAPQHAATRSPLAPPSFERRYFWLERRPGPGPECDQPAPGDAVSRPLGRLEFTA